MYYNTYNYEYTALADGYLNFHTPIYIYGWVLKDENNNEVKPVSEYLGTFYKCEAGKKYTFIISKAFMEECEFEISFTPDIQIPQSDMLEMKRYEFPDRNSYSVSTLGYSS